MYCLICEQNIELIETETDEFDASDRWVYQDYECPSSSQSGDMVQENLNLCE